jgi:hypothetical protein
LEKIVVSPRSRRTSNAASRTVRAGVPSRWRSVAGAPAGRVASLLTALRLPAHRSGRPGAPRRADHVVAAQVTSA